MHESVPHIEAGEQYLVCDANVGELFVQGWAKRATYYSRMHGGWSLPSTDIRRPSVEFVLYVGGGHGDQMFLAPAIRALHDRSPHWNIRVCVFPSYFAVWQSPGLEFVQLEPYPMKAVDLDGKIIVSFEGVIQPGKDAVSAMAERLCVEVADKQPYYSCTQAELEDAQERFPRTSRPRVGVQVKATAKCRSWPQQHIIKLVEEFSRQGIEVHLFGAPGEVNGQMPPHVTDLTSASPSLSFRESCAALALCDVVVAPDSALLHVAGALDIPAVGLYGPYIWQERTSHSPSIRALQGHGGCPMAPCFHHQRVDQPFPEGCPGESANQCTEMAALTPERVFQEVKKLLRV